MSPLPLVVVSYGVDAEMEAANRQVLDGLAEVVFLRKLTGPDRRAAISNAEVLVAWAFEHEVSRDDLEAATGLRFVQLISAGVDHVKLDAIAPGVTVASNVGAYAEPMAEHATAMALALMKRLPQRHAAMARGSWEQNKLTRSVAGSVCAIVGFGGIGKATANAMRCLGARIWAINTSGRTDEDVEFVGTLADLDTVLREADVLVLSLPLTRATRALVGERELQLMKPDAAIVNVARGAVVEETALYEHLRSNPEFGAGIDTWWSS
jgi:phosphoglycerate dehydrogenase-like enzyme